jgi:hypothetical protein
VPEIGGEGDAQQDNLAARHLDGRNGVGVEWIGHREHDAAIAREAELDQQSFKPLVISRLQPQHALDRGFFELAAGYCKADRERLRARRSAPPR